MKNSLILALALITAVNANAAPSVVDVSDIGTSYYGMRFLGSDTGRFFGNRFVSGDFDGDGFQDIAVVGHEEYIDSITWAPSDIQLADKVLQIHYGDGTFQGGMLDMTTDADAVFRNKLHWVFSDSLTYPHEEQFDMSVGDVNGDGLDDILVNMGLFDGTSWGSALIYGSSTRKFGMNNYDTDTDAHFVNIENAVTGNLVGYRMEIGGDYNGDGFDDIFIATEFRGEHCIALYWGTNPDHHQGCVDYYAAQGWETFDSPNGDESFGSASLYYGGAGTPFFGDVDFQHDADAYFWGVFNDGGVDAVAAADLNGDSYDDLIMSWGEGTYVFNGGPGMPMSGDPVMLSSYDIYFWKPSARVDYIGVGDVNGDGKQDILWGEISNSYEDVALSYGPFPLTDYNMVVTSPDVTFTQPFFDSVSTSSGWDVEVGNIDGDDYADILMTVRNASSTNNYIYYGPLSSGVIKDVSTTSDLKITGGDNLDVRGSKSSLHDYNGDGFDDILLGAFGDDENAVDAGALIVISGEIPFCPNRLSGTQYLNSIRTATGYGEVLKDWGGFSVSEAGDTNNDGFDDFVVSAHGNDELIGGGGAAYVFYGPVTGQRNFSTADYKFGGTYSSEYAGISVSTAGDVDDDGYDDLLIGTLIKGGYGKAYLMSGASYNSSSSTFPLSNADSIISSGYIGTRFGSELSGVGDVTGDGYDDFAIASQWHSGWMPSEGQVEIFEGPFPLGASISWQVASYTFYGDSLSIKPKLGSSISGGGDFNGDGFMDLVIGEPYNDYVASNGGAAHVVFGSFGGFPQSTYLDSQGTSGVTFHGISNNDHAGKSLSFVGDTNGDGYDDILVGAPRAGSSLGNTGEAYLIYGSPSLTGYQSLDEVGDAGDIPGIRFVGEYAGQEFGYRVSDARDFDGDGLDDFLIGANGDYAATAYLIYGTRAERFSPVDLSDPSVYLGARFQGDWTGIRTVTAVSAAGDVDGDGFNDILFGSYIGDAGFSYGKFDLVSGRCD